MLECCVSFHHLWQRFGDKFCGTHKTDFWKVTYMEKFQGIFITCNKISISFLEDFCKKYMLKYWSNGNLQISLNTIFWHFLPIDAPYENTWLKLCAWSDNLVWIWLPSQHCLYIEYHRNVSCQVWLAKKIISKAFFCIFPVNTEQKCFTFIVSLMRFDHIVSGKDLIQAILELMNRIK